MAIQSDPNQRSSHNFGFLTRIKYGGPLGKMTAVAACFFIVLLAVVIASRGNPYVLGGVVLIGLISLIFIVSQMKQVFSANPRMATLEGTEVIRYLEIELKSRNHEVVRGTVMGTLPQELMSQKAQAEFAEHEIIEERKDD